MIQVDDIQVKALPAKCTDGSSDSSLLRSARSLEYCSEDNWLATNADDDSDFVTCLSGNP